MNGYEDDNWIDLVNFKNKSIQILDKEYEMRKNAINYFYSIIDRKGETWKHDVNYNITTIEDNLLNGFLDKFKEIEKEILKEYKEIVERKMNDEKRNNKDSKEAY